MGTVILFAVGISVGAALLRTQAARWLADLIVQNLGLQQASAFAILMLLQFVVSFALTYWPWMGYMTQAVGS